MPKYSALSRARSLHTLPPRKRVPSQEVQVLKPHPLLPCEDDGVGMFMIFLARNSDGEFAVGHNTKENGIFLYIDKRLSFFSSARPRGAGRAALAFPRGKHHCSLPLCQRAIKVAQLYTDSYLNSTDVWSSQPTPNLPTQYFFFLPPA